MVEIVRTPEGYKAIESGGGNVIEVQDDGVSIEDALALLDFTGAGVQATQTAAGQVQVDIPGGSAPPLQSAQFLDNANLDLVVGTVADGCIVVDLSASNQLGESVCFRVTIGVAPSGPDHDCMQVRGVPPGDLTTIDTQTLLVGPNIVLRLVGSGAGTLTGVNYRIVDSIPRFF